MAPPTTSGSTGKGCLIAFAVVAIGGVLLAGTFIFVFGRAAEKVVDDIEEFGEENLGEADSGDHDTQLTACLAQPGGFPSAEGTLENTSDRTRGFSVTVSFTADDLRLDSATAFVEALGQDQTSAWRASASNQLPADVDPSEVTCTIEKVEYFF